MHIIKKFLCANRGSLFVLKLKLTHNFPARQIDNAVTKPGAQQSPVYAFLGTSGHLPAWNFSKYVIGKDGHKLKQTSADAPGDNFVRGSGAGSLHMEATRGTMERLASQLAYTAGRPVVSR